MAMVYEVWDTLTANRIGSFVTKAEATSLLLDVLRVNGSDVARDMIVLSSDTDAPDADPEVVVDGNELVAGYQIPA